MKDFLEIISCGHMDESIVAKVNLWTRGLYSLADAPISPSRISIFLWERTLDFLQFNDREKAELGIVTGGESDFLATHEAWKGFPRIHILLDKSKNMPEELIQGIVQHEVGHALLHGQPEFYHFRFSKQLQWAGSQAGLDLPKLQQLVYLLSIALKDGEVIQLLFGKGFGRYQNLLLEYLIEDTEEERQTFDLIRNDSSLRRLGMAAFLKTLLPIETIAELDVREAVRLTEKWEAAYSWLSSQNKAALKSFAQFVIKLPNNDFQDRLEQAAWKMIAEY